VERNKAATKSREASPKHGEEEDLPMVTIVWIFAEDDEWTMFIAVRLQEQDACDDATE
jgi:hypothetical protein